MPKKPRKTGPPSRPGRAGASGGSSGAKDKPKRSTAADPDPDLDTDPFADDPIFDSRYNNPFGKDDAV